MKKFDFYYLPLDKIDISISNVRKSNLEEGIEELACSLAFIGEGCGEVKKRISVQAPFMQDL